MSLSICSPFVETPFYEASANPSEPSPPIQPRPASSSPNTLKATQIQPFSTSWSDDVPRHNIQERCEVCSTIEKQHQDLYTQYQYLCAAYNQVRRDLDLQVQHTKAGDSMLNMERNVRMETEIRCQTLQHTVSTIENRQIEADKQQMATIAKLAGILYTRQVIGEDVASVSGQ